jgi:ankyrin repeat protein
MSATGPFQSACAKTAYPYEDYVDLLDSIFRGNLPKFKSLVQQHGAAILTTQVPAHIRYDSAYQTPGMKPIILAVGYSRDIFEYALSLDGIDRATGLEMLTAAIGKLMSDYIAPLTSKFAFTPEELGAELKRCVLHKPSSDCAKELVRLGAELRPCVLKALSDDYKYYKLSSHVNLYGAGVQFLDDGLTPTIVCASEARSPTLVQMLLNLGADMNATDASGRSARSIAYQEGNSLILDALNAELHNRYSPRDYGHILKAIAQDDAAALDTAVRKTGVDILRLKVPPLQGFCDISSMHYSVEMPLAQQIAVRSSNDAFKTVLCLGIDQEIGSLLLKGALEIGSVEKVSLLLQAQSFDRKELGKRLLAVTKRGKQDPMIATLVAGGADTSEALLDALSNPRTAALDIIIQAGVSVDAILTEGAIDTWSSPLITRACQSGRADIVKYLIDAGARLDIADSEGKLPLQYAEDPAIKAMVIATMTDSSWKTKTEIPSRERFAMPPQRKVLRL